MQVFDIRSTPRVLSSVHFRAGPAMLAFHPKFTSTLLVSSPAGVISLIDAQLNAFQQTMQVREVVEYVQMQALISSRKIVLT